MALHFNRLMCAHLCFAASRFSADTRQIMNTMPHILHLLHVCCPTLRTDYYYVFIIIYYWIRSKIKPRKCSIKCKFWGYPQWSSFWMYRLCDWMWSSRSTPPQGWHPHTHQPPLRWKSCSGFSCLHQLQLILMRTAAGAVKSWALCSLNVYGYICSGKFPFY